MRAFSLTVLLLATPLLAADLFTIQSNVVYGMYSGAALLLDVYKPTTPNGYGIIYVSGSGWTTPLALSAPELKSNSQSKLYASALANAGYTVFAVNHRSLPRFRYPVPVEDVQRAVRFIRYNAKTYGIRVDRIGASGGSSGGHLVSMLGTAEGKGNPTDPDPVERESSKVQCVVARAAPIDFLSGQNGRFLLGIDRPLPETPKDSAEYRMHVEASPISHVTPDDPPFLLMHGDKDEAVNIKQSEQMEAKLKSAGVPVKFLRIAGAGHGPTFPGATNPPDYLGEMVQWFNVNLIKK